MTVPDRFERHLLISALVAVLAIAEPSGFVTLALAGQPPEAARDPALPRSDQSAGPHRRVIPDADFVPLRRILKKAVEDRSVPGVSLLLAHKGHVIFKEAFGNLKVDQKVLMASSSKPVTASMVMILVDQGKLSLDDPLEKYLPEFKGITIKGKPPVTPPTVRHVLSNMSGLPGDFLAESLLKRLRKGAGKAEEPQKDDKPPAGPGIFSAANRSLAASVRELARTGLATEPGAEFHYCTMGFNVAARIAEVAGKRPFEELIRHELFEPLGMNHTRYTPIGVRALARTPTLPDGESQFIMAGGGMTSTLDDFAAFYQMHANRGTFQGRRIMSERSILEMHRRQAKLELLMAGPYGNDYGLSFFLDRLDESGNAHLITHPGLFGTTPWLDKDRELVGVFFVQSNFLRVLNLVRDVQTQVRALIP